AQRIVQRVRLPRVLTACLVGAALGMAGAIFQSISRNPLGSPDVIGFTTGAASEVASGPASNRMICTMAPLAAQAV
ncbi:iron chelate uptake ABC transporter family permease subunit, partial [Pseudomonas aeruginosa]